MAFGKKVYKSPVGPKLPDPVYDTPAVGPSEAGRWPEGIQEYERPIGPQLPKPVYDTPAGPNPQSARQSFLDKAKATSGKTQPWDIPEKGLEGMRSNPAGTRLTSTKPSYTSSPGPSSIPETGAPDFIAGEAPIESGAAKGFFSELGQLMKRWGAPVEALGKIAPVAGQLAKFIAPAGLAVAGYEATKNPAAEGDAEDRAAAFKSGQTLPRVSHISGKEEKDLSAQAQALLPDRAESPSGEPSVVSTSPVAQSQAKPTEEAPSQIQSHARQTESGRDATVAGNDAVPSFIATPKDTSNGNRKEAVAKQDKPLSDEDIVAWNAQHNKSFAPQEGGAVPFQPAQGPRQSDGVLFMGGNVYMSDPREPDGYKLIHSYGNS